MDDEVDRVKILDLWRRQHPQGYLSLKLCPKCRALTVHRRMRSAWAFLGLPDTVKCMECVRGR
jgi:hypothetical protein